MNRFKRGLAFLTAIALAGCAGPISQRDAVQTATARMNKYCGDSPQCRPLRFTHVEKEKDRWLVEFDTPPKAYAVIVDRDGNTQISIWDKSRDANGR